MPARRERPPSAARSIAAPKSLTEALPPGPDLPSGRPSNPVNLACPRGLGTGREAPLGSDSASRPEARPPRGNLGSPTLSFRTPGPGVLKRKGDHLGVYSRGNPLRRVPLWRPLTLHSNGKPLLRGFPLELPLPGGRRTRLRATWLSPGQAGLRRSNYAKPFGHASSARRLVRLRLRVSSRNGLGWPFSRRRCSIRSDASSSSSGTPRRGARTPRLRARRPGAPSVAAP